MPVEQPEPLPLILKQVQALGELHTAEYTYQNVFEYRTARDPQEWVARIPGGTSLVRGATRNSALVSATGQVEAGVDLSEASVQQVERGYVISLPEPDVYEPQVEATVRDYNSGVFWNDANIGLKAQADAERRMMDAAKRQGIEAEARENAADLVRDLVREITDADVKIEFRDS